MSARGQPAARAFAPRTHARTHTTQQPHARTHWRTDAHTDARATLARPTPAPERPIAHRPSPLLFLLLLLLFLLLLLLLYRSSVKQ